MLDADIFANALDLPAAERPAYLDRACAGDPTQRTRIEQLLTAHAAAGSDRFLEASTVKSRPLLQDDTPGTVLGERYTLIRKIGEGGCGTVYLAEQTIPVRRQVALKVIKLGMDTRDVIARFEAERQALALMDHPDIARVFDAGATATGRPFFVMEFVDGIPITKFCDAHNLTMAARLALFARVCLALQHAHQKGVIHRDLKPSNILVTLRDGVPAPRIIDFGIAKATSGRLSEHTLVTALDQFIGTPAYMSPEQAEHRELDLDTRSDIYSLGVLLYELLSGRPPYDPKSLAEAGLAEIRRIIREIDPPRPSARVSTLTSADRATVARLRGAAPQHLAAALKGDLDWIVMRCLEKDRARRYDTASALADDLNRYLAHEPVTARPASNLYRLRKLARRHRLAFAAVTAVSLAVLVGLAVSTTQYLRATRAERAARAAEKSARDQAAATQAVNDFLTEDLLGQAGSLNQADQGHAPDPDLKVRDALDRAAEKVGDRFATQPRTEAAVRLTLGNAYLGVGLPDKAIAHLTRSIALRPPHSDAPGDLFVQQELARAYDAANRLPESIELSTRLLAQTEKALGPDAETTIHQLDLLAVSYGKLGKYDEALPLLTQALERSRRVRGPEHIGTLHVTSHLANLYLNRGDNAASIPLFREALALQRRLLVADHPNTLETMNNLAVAYQRTGDLPGAIAMMEETLQAFVRINGPDHPDTFQVTDNLVDLYRIHGDYATALTRSAANLEAARRVLGPEHPLTLSVMGTLGAAQFDAGQNAEAIALLTTALDLQRRVVGPEHFLTLFSLVTRGNAYLAAGDLTPALADLTLNLEIRRRNNGPKHARTLIALNDLAAAQLVAKEFPAAEALLRELLPLREQLTPDDWTTSQTRSALGAALLGRKNYAAAEPLLLAGYSGLAAHETALPQSARHHLPATRARLAELYTALGRPAEAAKWSAPVSP